MHFWIPSIGVSNLAAIPQNSKFFSWRNDLLVTSLKDMSIYRLKLKENAVIGIERIPLGFRIRDILVHNDIIYLLEDGIPTNIWSLSLGIPSENLP
jgi:glucose/arabinose dehydrogenase